MSFMDTAAGRALQFQRDYPCRVAFKRYKSARKKGASQVPPRGPNSRITYRNSDGDFTVEFGFKTPPEALEFARTWGIERDYLKKGTR